MSMLTSPLHPAGEAEHDPGTRVRVRELVVARGPIGAARLADILELTPAGVRRHLAALVAAGEIIERHDHASGPRGRGRPAKTYVATVAAQEHLPDNSAQLASHALHHLVAALGPGALTELAEQRLADFETTYAPVVEAAGPDVAARAQALAAALSDEGYAASIRALPSHAVQLCQGHCPIRQIASEFPQLCEAETRLIARMLGVHVQRLATIASGGHACTTHIPHAVSHRTSPTTDPPTDPAREGTA